ncbi:MFS transporter [Streptomyces albicerus]|uniref:MFS transporter n=1 Tax=Streptomyces albicerus TaxID=2569859 RepID=UPI00124BA49D|nr:MFS transporter [Streptomyces albicerus]
MSDVTNAVDPTGNVAGTPTQATESEPPVASAAPSPAPESAPSTAKAPLLRIGIMLGLAGIGWPIAFGAASNVLLPARLAELDSTGKTAALGTLTIAGSVIALLANILFGALSDRTRSRWGSRNPWVALSSVAAAASMAMMATAGSVLTLGIWWCVFQLFLNALLAPLVAIVADRVPHLRRGTISAAYGSGTALGMALGAILGSRFLTDTSTGFVVLPLGMLAVGLLFPFVARDDSNRHEPRPALTAGTLLASFAIPRNCPDFLWGIAARLLTVLSFFAVVTYQLYILTDYMHASPAVAATTIGAAGLALAGGAVLAGAVAGPISDAIGRRKLPVIIASLMTALGALLPLISPHPGTMIAFAALAGAGYGIYLSVDSALMTELLPDQTSRGKDLGILNVSNTGGQIIAPAVGSLTVGITHSYAPMFVIAAVMGVAAALCMKPIRGVR